MNIPLNINWQQILLHLFNFVILFALLYFLLYKPVKNFMEKRTAYYKDLDQQAKDKLAQAEKLAKEYDDRMAQIDTEIAQKQQEAQKILRDDKARLLKAAQAESEQVMEKARLNAEYLKEELLRETQTEISDMIASAAEKIVFPDTETAYDTFLNRADQEASSAPTEGSDVNEG